MAWHPFRNPGLKVTATLLGVLLWLTVSGHQVERRVSVPLSFSNVPQPLELTGEGADAVNVHVRGDGSVVSGLSGDNVRVVVNLADARPGENLVALRTDLVVTPLGVEVLAIEPGSLQVTLERALQTEVIVRARVEGTVAPGFQISAIRLQPATATIAGPESRVTGRVLSVLTDRVDVTDRSSTFTAEAGVGVEDSRLRVVQPRTVRVTVQIEPVPPVPTEMPEPTDPTAEVP